VSETGENLLVRPATEGDLEALVAIHTFAFPDPRGHEARVRNFNANPLGGLDRLRVVCDRKGGDRIVGHAFLFDIEVFFGGAPVRTAAIATVGVAPAARGRGIASHVVSELLAEASRARMPIAMLHAWRQGFYARLGFAPTSPYQRLALVPASIPFEAPRELRVRHCDGEHRAGIERCYERAASRSTGFLRRSTELWDSAFSDERTTYSVALAPDGEVRGACSARLEQTEAHAKVTLVVEDFFARDDAAERALFAHLRAFRDQAAEIHVSLAWDHPLTAALVDADANRFGDAIVEHHVGTVCAGPMVRANDARALLADRGYRADGDATIVVNDDALRVSVRAGRAEITNAKSGATPDLVLERNAASVIAGGIGVREASRLGWARAKDEAALIATHELLATGAFFGLDAF
jgi:predicted acetyltransferase